jgi:hypothetical protein
MALACLAAGYGLGFHVDPVRAIPLTLGILLLAGGMTVGTRRARPRLRAGATAFLQMTLFTVFGVVLAYALAARAGPLWDPAFTAADRWLGFDWPAVFAAADRAPLLLWIGGLAYHSLTLQMIVCIVVLSATGRADTLRTAVTAAILGGFATIALSGLLPAMGNVFDPAAYHRLWPSVAWVERDMIAGLRDGSWRTLDLTQLMGIVSFPSYHATLPVILSWAQRDVRGWRIVASLWAVVTIVATPVFGGHYAVDVLGGLAMAGLALVGAPYLVRPRRITLQNLPHPASHAGPGRDRDVLQRAETGSGVMM